MTRNKGDGIVQVTVSVSSMQLIVGELAHSHCSCCYICKVGEGMTFTGMCMELFHNVSYVRKGQLQPLLNSHLFHNHCYNTVHCIGVVCGDDNNNIYIYMYIKTIKLIN